MPVTNKYTIRKGKHYCHPRPFSLKWNLKTLAFDFTFLPDCMYNLGNEDQFDYNKLFGIGWGLNHHKNSYRLGWRYDVVSGKIEIAQYYYNKGVRKFNTILFVEIGKTYGVKLKFLRDNNSITAYIIDLEAGVLMDSTDLDYYFESVSRFSFLLFPYFGGNQTAPHDMNISIQKY